MSAEERLFEIVNVPINKINQGYKKKVYLILEL